MYLSSLVSFFFVVFTLATVSRTAWSPQRYNNQPQKSDTQIIQPMMETIKTKASHYWTEIRKLLNLLQRSSQNVQLHIKMRKW